MTGNLYGRRVTVSIHAGPAPLAFETPSLIRFDLQRTADDTPVRGEITLHNLAPATEARIRERGTRIQIHAGYENGRYGMLFDGGIRRIARGRVGLDRVLHVFVGPDFTRVVTVDTTYAGAVSVRQIVSDIARDAGLRIASLDAIPDEQETDFHVFGQLGSALNSILIPRDVRWYEDNGSIRFTRIGESQDDRTGITISQESGMIDTPVVTDDGLRVQTLIDPRIDLDSLVRVKSAIHLSDIAGDWKVTALRHRGDSRIGPFLTTMELRPAA